MLEDLCGEIIAYIYHIFEDERDFVALRRTSTLLLSRALAVTRDRAFWLNRCDELCKEFDWWSWRRQLATCESPCHMYWRLLCCPFRLSPDELKETEMLIKAHAPRFEGLNYNTPSGWSLVLADAFIQMGSTLGPDESMVLDFKEKFGSLRLMNVRVDVRLADKAKTEGYRTSLSPINKFVSSLTHACQSTCANCGSCSLVDLEERSGYMRPLCVSCRVLETCHAVLTWRHGYAEQRCERRYRWLVPKPDIEGLTCRAAPLRDPMQESVSRLLELQLEGEGAQLHWSAASLSTASTDFRWFPEVLWDVPARRGARLLRVLLLPPPLLLLPPLLLPLPLPLLSLLLLWLLPPLYHYGSPEVLSDVPALLDQLPDSSCSSRLATGMVAAYLQDELVDSMGSSAPDLARGCASNQAPAMVPDVLRESPSDPKADRFLYRLDEDSRRRRGFAIMAAGHILRASDLYVQQQEQQQAPGPPDSPSAYPTNLNPPRCPQQGTYVASQMIELWNRATV